MSGVRVGRRLAAAFLLAAAVVPAAAGPASAHVSVDGGDARQGGSDAVLTFRVPNERANATTVSVSIKLPTRTPLASVKPAGKAGWTVTTTRVTFPSPITTDDGAITEGVGQVTFTAASPAAAIPVGGFDTFQLLVGPLPKDVASLAFPTVQTYSNGDVSSWIQSSVPGSEAEHPAPVLELAPAVPGDGRSGVPSGGRSDGPASELPGRADVATRGDVRTARVLGLVGVVTGALGLLAAGYAIGRTRQRPEVPGRNP